MKKVLFSLFAVLAMSFTAMAENGDAYTIDDNAIEQVFAQSTDVTVGDVELFNLQGMMPAAPGENLVISSKNPWAAWALCWVLGGFGIHRHYMGTAGYMWALYTFTIGGIFGIVPTVDWVVLLIGAIQGNISEYTNNTKFFMWA